MKTLLIRLAVLASVLLAIAIAAMLLVLAAFGLGWLLSRFLPFSTFEATLFSLIAMISVVLLLWQLVAFVMRSSPTQEIAEDDEEDWEDEDWLEKWEDKEEDWEDEDRAEEEIPDPPDFIPSIPRWRQPIKRANFEKAGRNDPCPCGSGKKYKNCHGKPGVAN